jgi:hypothetical protein
VVYSYAPGRAHAHAARLLGGYRGILQCDGYAAYKTVAGAKTNDGAVTLAFCWSHVRRGFYDLAKSHAPVAVEALRRIGALYRIEEGIRGTDADHRLAVRQAESQPLLAELRVWFETQLAKLPARGDTAEAIRYALNHWSGLERFAADGRIELDSNSIERAMRPVALSRKNALFAGSDEGGENWARMASLIETCLCRARHKQVYAARQTMPNGFRDGVWLSRLFRLLHGRHVHTIRHSLVAQSASRKASNRSSGRKRVRLPPWYGVTLANAASLSARCACR